MSSQDGCVNYLTKQTIAVEWQYPSSIGMTYPKSENRNKHCGPFALSGTGWVLRHNPEDQAQRQMGRTTVYLRANPTAMDAFSRLLCVQDISGFCNCSDLTAPDESYPILLSPPPRWPNCSLFLTESPTIH